jgi:hypothetical protein
MELESEVTEVTQPEIETETPQVEDTGPETMLEAISEGIKPETEEAKQERLRDEAGRFAKKDEVNPEAVKPVEAKPQDEFAVPEGISAKAQERFKSLVSKVHESQSQLQAVSQQVEQFREVVRDTGASPTEISTAFDYIKMVKHGNLEGALQVLDEQRRQISCRAERTDIRL